MTTSEHAAHSPEPLSITNESFIGGPDKSELEEIYDTATMDSYWRDMETYAPAEAQIYSRNTSLIGITERVARGEVPMTGKIQDAREVCELFFERQGATNPLRGADAPNRLFKMAGRYFELCVADQSEVTDESVPYDQIPAVMAELFRTGQIKEGLAKLSDEQRVTFGTMLLEVATSYNANNTPEDARVVALRNNFERWAEGVFVSVNRQAGRMTSMSAPAFLSQAQRRAWAHIYDIRFARVGRLQDEAERDAAYHALLQQQALEAKVMLSASQIPESRSMDGLLYEYFLPVAVRYHALQTDQGDALQIRRATIREDQPIDGMTHPERTVDYNKYSFDMLLQYPLHDRTVFLQTKIGRETEGYDEGVAVFNHHAGIPNLRAHMRTASEAMFVDLTQPEQVGDERKRLLRHEMLRVSSLLPEAVA